MTGIFKLAGALLAAYVLRCIASGSVYARSGIWGRTFRREEERWNFWGAILAYSLLSLALLFVF
jgi:hypothetical protein